MDRPVLITVIIPCYRSEHYIEQTADEIFAAFRRRASYRLQLILIDDASPDQTAGKIRDLCERYPGTVSGIYLPVNNGQARAKMCGIPKARGKFAVFMDDDGQHDPEKIFDLIEALKQDPGLRMVYAQFPVQKESLPRRMASEITSLGLCLTAGKRAGLKITSFFAVDSRALAALRKYKSSRPFIGGYIWHVFGKNAVGTVLIPHRQRISEKSSYSLKKLFRTWYALNTSMREIRRYPTTAHAPRETDRPAADR